MRATSSTRVAPLGAPGCSPSSSFMDDVKLGAGDRRKAAEAASGRNGAPRRPLVPSETGNAAAPGGQRREAASRFKPAAPSAPTRRSTSPSPARESCNRAQSAGKARPATTSAAPLSSQLKPSALASPARDAGAEARGTPRATSAKAPDGLWASARNSSPSRRTESAPAPTKKIDRLVRGLPSSEVAKAKVQADATPVRKRSPVRRNSTGNQCENACPSESLATKRVVEQHRWPAMTGGRGSAGLTSASTAPSTGNASRSLSVTSSNPSAGHFPMKKMRPSEGTGKCLSPSSEMAKRAALRQSRREDADGDASSQTSEGSKSACRPSRAISVPVLRRSSSPSKVASFAASKACQSPSRIRASAPCRSKCASSAARQGAAQPVSNYMADPRKGKKTENQVENIHRLRLLENRYLQWRFVNAISEATLSFRRNSAETTIFSVSNSILALQDALTTTRIDVRFLQQEMKLHHIVTEQITYLEQWPELEEENIGTLAEITEALKASTLRLPVTSRAQADAVAVKNAVGSALDVMQALCSSIFYLQSKVEDRTSLASEVSVMARQENAALDECRQLLATATKLQVQESSIHTHLMQLGDDSR